MTIRQLYRGGTPQVNFPGCFGQQVFGPPFPWKVAGEYGRGDFTLGEMLQPASRPYQAAALDGAAVGDVVELVVVPEEHSLTQLFLKVEPHPPRSAGTSPVGCIRDSMNGVTFDLVGNFYDTETYALLGPWTPPANFTGIDASVDASTHAFVQEYIPLGQVLVLGVRLLSAPTNAGITFADMGGRIVVNTKVHDFDYPWM